MKQTRILLTIAIIGAALAGALIGGHATRTAHAVDAISNPINPGLWVNANDYILVDITPLTAQSSTSFSMTWRILLPNGTTVQNQVAPSGLILSSENPNAIAYGVFQGITSLQAQNTTSTLQGGWLEAVNFYGGGSVRQYQAGDWGVLVELFNTTAGNPCPGPALSSSCLGVTSPVNALVLISTPITQEYPVEWTAAGGPLQNNNLLGPPGYYTDAITPGAGSECSAVGGVGSRIELLSVMLSLQTSSTAANRTVSLEEQGDGAGLNYISSGQTQTASTTEYYDFVQGLGNIISSPSTGFVGYQLFDIPFGQNWILDGVESPEFTTYSTNLQSGDQYHCTFHFRIWNSTD